MAKKVRLAVAALPAVSLEAVRGGANLPPAHERPENWREYYSLLNSIAPGGLVKKPKPNG